MKERRAYWDNLKGLLMILVVVAHFMQTNTIVSQAVYAGIYFFHMPLFIFVSGVFQHGRIKERVTSLVAIGIVYNAVLILVDNVMIGVQQEFYVFRATKIPWFVFSVALCDLMTYVVRDFDKRFVLTFSFLIGLVACYDANLVSYMSIAKAVGWFPFYYLGYLLGPDMMDMPKKKRVVLILGGVTVVAYICAVLLSGKFDNNITSLSFIYGVASQFPSMSFKWLVVKAVYYIGVMVISFSIMCITPDRNIPCLTYIGKKTMQIYFWHIPLRSLIFATGIQNLFSAKAQGKILWGLLSVLLTAILSTKPFRFPTEYIIKCMRKERS